MVEPSDTFSDSLEHLNPNTMSKQIGDRGGILGGSFAQKLISNLHDKPAQMIAP